MNARQKIDKLIIDHQKEFGFHSNFDFMNELLAEIEEERDAFAAGFLKWYRNNAVPSKTGHLSSEQILEQYKKTLLIRFV